MRFVVALVALAVIAVVGFVALDPGLRKIRADEAQYNEQRLQLQLERDRRRAEQLEPVRVAVDGIMAAWPVYVCAAGVYAVITMARAYRSVVMYGDAPVSRRILERSPELTMHTVAARNQPLGGNGSRTASLGTLRGERVQ